VKELEKMEKEMKEYYTREKPRTDVDKIKEGNVFAILDDKNQWRRYEELFL